MSEQKKQWVAIIIMIALFAMIAFVTNLCSPMAIIVKNQFGASDFLAQVGNYGNFIAYLVMGIPSGMLIKRYGYKKTALLALLVGIVGILVQWMSGWSSVESFAVYLVGAFIAGFCMCMLNTVVNPMLNLLGGGGNKGNQLIQIGGVFNSTAAVAVYIIMGALIGNAAKAKISDVTPALFIALGIFVVGFIVILFSKIQEPEQHIEVKKDKKVKDKYSAFSFRHFNLGILAIFLYMGIEVGVPTYVLQYLTSDTEAVKNKKELVMQEYEQNKFASVNEAAVAFIGATTDVSAIRAKGDREEIEDLNKQITDVEKKITEGTITAEKVSKTVPGRGMNATIVGLIVAVYWFLMLVGRLVGGTIGGKVSSRAMITTVSITSLVFVAFGMFAPTDITVNVPGIDWANVSLIWAEVPIGIFAFLLVGLCTSVMWGGIFNMAVEGLGKYTAIASGAFMTMVFGCAVMVAIQAGIAGLTGSYLASYVVVLFCAAYILFYALVGSKNVNKDIPVE